MRSIWSSGIASSVAAPTVDDETRNPSTRTHRLAAIRAAQEHARRSSRVRRSGRSRRPAGRCRSSAKLSAPRCAISSASITVTSATSVAIGCGMRARRHHDRVELRDRRRGHRLRRRKRRPEQSRPARAPAGHRRWAGGRFDPWHRVSPCGRATPHGGDESAHEGARRGRVGASNAAPAATATTPPRVAPGTGRNSPAGRSHPGAGRSPGSPCGSTRLPVALGATVASWGTLEGLTVAGAAAESGPRPTRHRIPVSPAAMSRGGHLLADGIPSGA